MLLHHDTKKHHDNTKLHITLIYHKHCAFNGIFLVFEVDILLMAFVAVETIQGIYYLTFWILLHWIFILSGQGCDILSGKEFMLDSNLYSTLCTSKYLQSLFFLSSSHYEEWEGGPTMISQCHAGSSIKIPERAHTTLGERGRSECTSKIVCTFIMLYHNTYHIKTNKNFFLHTSNTFHT